MLFLINYDRGTGRLVDIRQFSDEETSAAQLARFELELSLQREGQTREVVLLEAASEDDLRRTHGRYFGDIGQLIEDMSNFYFIALFAQVSASIAGLMRALNELGLTGGTQSASRVEGGGQLVTFNASFSRVVSVDRLTVQATDLGFEVIELIGPTRAPLSQQEYRDAIERCLARVRRPP